MAALLGYRFERALRDAGMPQYMLECRRAFPLRPAGTAASDEAQEAIAARDVVDGVRLMDAYRTRQGDVRDRRRAARADPRRRRDRAC